MVCLLLCFVCEVVVGEFWLSGVDGEKAIGWQDFEGYYMLELVRQSQLRRRKARACLRGEAYDVTSLGGCPLSVPAMTSLGLPHEPKHQQSENPVNTTAPDLRLCKEVIGTFLRHMLFSSSPHLSFITTHVIGSTWQNGVEVPSQVGLDCINVKHIGGLAACPWYRSV